jgi:LysR family hydrogen peroxide-inducible transcriptional activator
MNVAALSLRDLEYVVAVTEERHFGRAAERCNVSQPSLSAQIRRLEEALGLTLFERTSRKVLPTARGEAVARQARAVLAEAQKLLVVAQEGADALSGRLALGAIQTLGPYLFPRVLRDLRQGFPDLLLTLTEGRTADLLDALREGRLDAVLLSPPIDEVGLTLAPLFDEPFLLCCPADHPLARARALRADTLAGPELLLLEEGNCLRDQALAACAAGPHAGRHATSLETLRSMVAAGAGYTLMPRLASEEGTDASGLVISRSFERGGPTRTIALAWRATDPRRGSLDQLAAFFRHTAPNGTTMLGQATKND